MKRRIPIFYLKDLLKICKNLIQHDANHVAKFQLIKYSDLKFMAIFGS